MNPPKDFCSCLGMLVLSITTFYFTFFVPGFFFENPGIFLMFAYTYVSWELSPEKKKTPLYQKTEAALAGIALLLVSLKLWHPEPLPFYFDFTLLILSLIGFYLLLLSPNPKQMIQETSTKI